MKDLREKYYNWQWTTKPSDDPQLFYPKRTNREIYDFFISHIEDKVKEVLDRLEGEKEHIQKHSKGNYADGKVEAFTEAQQIISEVFKEEK